MAQTQVTPKKTNPPGDVELSDGVKRWILQLEGGEKGIVERAQTPSSYHILRGGQRFGRFEPQFSHVEQRSWSGGRAMETFEHDETSYFDAWNTWTLTPDKVMPAPQWAFAEGLVNAHNHLPGSNRLTNGRDVKWQALLSGDRYARSFTTDASSFNARRIQIWVRSRGRPGGTLTCELRNDTASAPGSTVHASDTLVIGDADEEEVSFLHRFFPASFALVGSTTYWVVIYSSANDSVGAHWEVGIGDAGTDQALVSTDGGSSWGNTSNQLYFRIAAGFRRRYLHPFQLGGAMYVVEERLNGGVSSLYLNGDRGRATGGATTTLTDTDSGMYGSAWPTNLWAGARIRIYRGTGKGQVRGISSNTGTVITVDEDWDVNPSTDSDYVIFGTPEFIDITPSTGDQIDGVVTGVDVYNNIAIFAQGPDVNILKMRYNGSATPPVHEFDDDGTNRADFVRTVYNPVSGETVIWRAENDSVDISKADAVAWATNLTFRNTVEVGDKTYLITNLGVHGGQLMVHKENSLWLESNEKVQRLEVGLDDLTEPTNGRAWAVQDTFYFFNWSHSIERLNQGVLDDVGPWKRAGLPDGRAGVVSDMESVIGLLFLAIDPGQGGTGSVLYTDFNGAWHEIFRAWRSNRRCTDVWWQSVPGGRPILWINCLGELVYLEFPQNTINPVNDADQAYQHESHIVSATHDMTNVGLFKLFKELDVVSENLSTAGVEIAFEYQLDDDIGGTLWTPMNTVFRSPYDTAEINRGGRRKLRYRMRMLTTSATTPPIVDAVVLKGFSRTPVKQQWDLRLRVGSSAILRNRQGGPGTDPDKLYEWIKRASSETRLIRMRSKYPAADRKWVSIEPPGLLRNFVNTFQAWWTGTVVITVREA